MNYIFRILLLIYAKVSVFSNFGLGRYIFSEYRNNSVGVYERRPIIIAVSLLVNEELH